MIDLHDRQLAEIEGGDFWDGIACGLALAGAIFEPTPLGELAAVAVCGEMISKM